MAIYDSCSFKFVSFESLYLLRIIWRFDLSMRISAVLRAPQVCKTDTTLVINDSVMPVGTQLPNLIQEDFFGSTTREDDRGNVAQRVYAFYPHNRSFGDNSVGLIASRL